MKKNIVWISLGVAAAAGTAILLGGWLAGWKEVKIQLDPDYNELFSKEEVLAAGPREALPEYATDVTIGYRNPDGTKSLYVFASPIRYKNPDGQWSLIDSRIVNLRDEELRDQGYVYTIANSDVKSYFPKKATEEAGIRINRALQMDFGFLGGKETTPRLQTRPDFIGQEKTMLLYKGAVPDGDAWVYPTSSGVNCELQLREKPENSEISFWFQLHDKSVRVQKSPGGYLTLVKNKTGADGKSVKDILGVIQKPLLRGPQGEVSYLNTVDAAAKGDNRYELRFRLDGNVLKEGSSVFIAFEMRREKQPDNAVYSKLPDLEHAYLRNYSVIGQSEDAGIGRLMIRYKFAKPLGLRSASVKKATYSTYTLGPDRQNLELVRLLEDWCSLTGNWSKQYKTGARASLLEQAGPELKFDITDEVRAWCLDPEGQLEHNGVLLKDVEEREGVYGILLSNDNTLYHNKTEIILQ